MISLALPMEVLVAVPAEMRIWPPSARVALRDEPPCRMMAPAEITE